MHPAKTHWSELDDKAVAVARAVHFAQYPARRPARSRHHRDVAVVRRRHFHSPAVLAQASRAQDIRGHHA